MNENDLAEAFESHRAHLRAVAYRMLGSLGEAEDAVQEAWLNVSRSGAGGVENLRGWLTTVVARVCLDLLRRRKSRREEPLPSSAPDTIARGGGPDPEEEVVMADSLGLALLVVLEMLDPAERLAFVLHDMFGVPFEEIAGIVGRSPAAARQLASRARRRVQGADRVPSGDVGRQREVVGAFLAAMRGGDIEGLVAVLDPDVVVTTEGPAGVSREIRGARNWAKGAVAFAKQARSMAAALVDGRVGIVLAPGGRLSRAVTFTFAGDTIARVEIISDPTRIARLDIAVLDEV